jgi:four helix bundle protein
MDLVEECYLLTANLPKNEEFGLKNQIRSAAVSIPSNSAEGHSRCHSRELLQYLSIFLSSLAELETHIDLAGRLNFIPRSAADKGANMCEEVGRMLHGLVHAIRQRSHQSPVPDP